MVYLRAGFVEELAFGFLGGFLAKGRGRLTLLRSRKGGFAVALALLAFVTRQFGRQIAQETEVRPREARTSLMVLTPAEGRPVPGRAGIVGWLV